MKPEKNPKPIHFRLPTLLLGATLAFAACGGDDAGSQGNGEGGQGQGDKIRVAFVTNQIASFWNIAKAGCEVAEEDFGVEVVVKMPPEATAVKQKQIVEDLISSGIDGIAISPLDAENQVAWINEIAAKVPLITHDSDCPGSNRRSYIGMDNYKAGRMCGELVLKALPEGGEIMLFIGRLEQDNSKHRRQGVIDEILGRPVPASHADINYDPVDEKVEGGKYTILGTVTDQGVETVAKAKAEDAINTYPELKAMVGLFAYNPPQCLQALRQAGKLGEIKLIGFDEDDDTLQGIKDGTVVGTVVQDPFEYGYQSVQVLKGILDGHDVQDFIDIKPRTVTSENVDDFWEDLKSKQGG